MSLRKGIGFCQQSEKCPALPFLYLILMYTEDIKTGFEFYAENSNCE